MIKKLDYWRNLVLGTHDEQARLMGDLELGIHMINKLDYWSGLGLGDTCDKQARQWRGLGLRTHCDKQD